MKPRLSDPVWLFDIERKRSNWSIPAEERIAVEAGTQFQAYRKATAKAMHGQNYTDIEYLQLTLVGKYRV